MATSKKIVFTGLPITSSHRYDKCLTGHDITTLLIDIDRLRATITVFIFPVAQKKFLYQYQYLESCPSKCLALNLFPRE